MGIPDKEVVRGMITRLGSLLLPLGEAPSRATISA